MLTGSVSRGVADDISDIEMLIVTEGEVDPECRAMRTDSDRRAPFRRRADLVVSRERRLGARFDLHGRPHCECGRDRQRSRLADVRAAGAVAGTTAPLPGRARQRTDRGCGPQMGRLPCLRSLDTPSPGRAAGARRVAGRRRGRIVRIVFALNRVWQPTLKRIADRTSVLTVKPDRLAERIAEALTEPRPTTRSTRHGSTPGGDPRARARRAERRARAQVDQRRTSDPGSPHLRRRP